MARRKAATGPVPMAEPKPEPVPEPAPTKAAPIARARRAPAAAKPRRPAPPRVPKTDASERLQAVAAALEQALADVPRASEFEPLAEHLYELARAAPTLAAALDQVPRAAQPVQEAVRALQEVSETLQFTQESFAESILSLPTAAEYEPLVGPLSEFAKVAPELSASLRQVLGATEPLRDTGRALDRVVERLEAAIGKLGRTAAAPAQLALRGAAPDVDATARALAETGAAFDERLRALGEVVGALERRARAEAPAAVAEGVLADVEAARDAVQDALAGLPRDDDYRRVAQQLREIATVSPSLMEWLQQVATIETPLQASVESLAGAARRLDRAAAALGGHSEPRDLQTALRAIATVRQALADRASSSAFDPADEVLWQQIRELGEEADALRALIPAPKSRQR